MKVHPLAREALHHLPAPKGSIVVVIPDSTRPMDLDQALQAIHSWAGDRVSGVRIGLGLHRESTQAELQSLRHICPWEIQDHDPDDCVALGEVDGIPVEVARPVATADHIVTVGRVELHQYAGFSGGYKGVVVGCGGRRLIEALHERSVVTQPGVRVGQLQDNPFRSLIDRIGGGLAPTTALQWIPGNGWVAGDPVGVLRIAEEASRPFAPSSKTVDRVLIALPASKAVNLYQASRGATYLALSPRPPLNEGAQIVLEAACPEGVGLGAGEANFARALRSCAPPWTPLLTDPTSFGGGSQRAVMLALLAERYHLVLTGCSDPRPIRELGIEAHSESAETLFGTFELVVPDPFRQLPQLV